MRSNGSTGNLKRALTGIDEDQRRWLGAVHFLHASAIVWPFPLTPTLSLREREPCRPIVRQLGAPRFLPAQEIFLPLPSPDNS